MPKKLDKKQMPEKTKYFLSASGVIPKNQEIEIFFKTFLKSY